MKPNSFLPAVILIPVVMLMFFQTLALGASVDQQSAGQEKQSVSPADAQAVRAVFRSISPAVAAKLIDQEEGLLIVDVRTPQERKQFRISDSLLIPVGDVMRGRFRPEADRPILVICAVGGRSYVAGKVMTARGHQEVYNLEGGIESWRRAGLPIETGPENHANQ